MLSPRAELPELVCRPPDLTTLFAVPTFVWVPEALDLYAQPHCIVQGCKCMPTVLSYPSRAVDDVSHKTLLIYTEYQCSGDNRTAFTTVGDRYLRRSPLAKLHFPYTLAVEGGISRELMDLVHDVASIGSDLESLSQSIRRRRNDRYHRLLMLFDALVRERSEAIPAFILPEPCRFQVYQRVHAMPSSSILADLLSRHRERLPIVTPPVPESSASSDADPVSEDTNATVPVEEVSSAVVPRTSTSNAAISRAATSRPPVADGSNSAVSVPGSSNAVAPAAKESNAVVPVARVPLDVFTKSISLSPTEEETARAFTIAELDLLLAVRGAQLFVPADCPWRECSLVATILYNAIATRVGDESADIHERSHDDIASNIAWLKATGNASATAGDSTQPLFVLRANPVRDEAVRRDERMFAENICTTLSRARWPSLKETFFKLYDFGAHVQDDVYRKSEDALERLFRDIHHTPIDHRPPRSMLSAGVPYNGSRAVGTQQAGMAPVLSEGRETGLEGDVNVHRITNDAGSAGERACAPKPSSVGVGTSAAVVDDSSEPDANKDSEDDVVMETLMVYEQTLAQSIARRWVNVHEKYRELVALPILGVNALRCHLRRRKLAAEKASRQSTSEPVPKPTPPTSAPPRARTTPAAPPFVTANCSVCRANKRKCGDPIKSPTCLRLRVGDADASVVYAPRTRLGR